MATTWSTVQSEIQAIVKDADFQTGGASVAYLLTYANDAQLKICEMVDIRRMLKTSTVTATASAYVYDMPSDFLRISPSTRVYVGSTDYFIKQVTREYLNYIDPNHNQTTTATNGPTLVSFDGSKILIYPMWAGTLNITDYFEKPTAMTVAGSAVGVVSEGITGDNLVKDAMVDYTCYKVYDKWLKRRDDAQSHYASFLKGINELKRVNPTDATVDFVSGAFG